MSKTDLGSGTAPGLVAWRRQQLLQSGFPAPLAAAVAGARGFDLHALIELAEAGCPAELAVRILAPLDDNGELA